jgi:undecaprenyl phosphate-alpha-L-ara4N flippase subunit ArnF
MRIDQKAQRAFFYLASSIVLSACAQLLMKAGMLALAGIDSHGSMEVFNAVFDNGQIAWFILSGLICYAVSMLSWLLALTRYQLSLAYPLLGISYVLVYLGAVLWQRIGEEFTLQRSTGIILVFVGVMLVNYRNSTTESFIEKREPD